jgi:hypothetical protein
MLHQIGTRRKVICTHDSEWSLEFVYPPLLAHAATKFKYVIILIVLAAAALSALEHRGERALSAICGESIPDESDVYLLIFAWP